jgi:hypothetical protein
VSSGKAGVANNEKRILNALKCISIDWLVFESYIRWETEGYRNEASFAPNIAESTILGYTRVQRQPSLA